MADEHLRSAADHEGLAQNHLDGGNFRSAEMELRFAQLHATLHLAEQVTGVAYVLDYIDGKLARQ